MLEFTIDKNKDINILIVDSNRTFAGIIKETLGKYLKNQNNVDICTNVWELKRRLNGDSPYNIILADISVACDGDAMAQELNKTKTPVIAWTTYSKEKLKNIIPSNYLNHCKVIKKPGTSVEINKALSLITNSVPALVA